jgi:hypothetical protein
MQMCCMSALRAAAQAHACSGATGKVLCHKTRAKTEGTQGGRQSSSGIARAAQGRRRYRSGVRVTNLQLESHRSHGQAHPGALWDLDVSNTGVFRGFAKHQPDRWPEAQSFLHHRNSHITSRHHLNACSTCMKCRREMQDAVRRLRA